MADTTRVQYYIDNDALSLVESLAPSEKRRGEWVGKAIREYAAMQAVSDSDQDCGTLEQLVSMIKRLEQRIIRLDSRIAS